MKILICDRLLVGKPNSDWKEGWEFYYAFKNIGVECDIAGLNCPIPETKIPEISQGYDFVLVRENYPGRDWKWWDWKLIKTTKMFWAIDTHLVDYNNWLRESSFDYVGLNNEGDLNKYSNFKNFHFPYGVSKRYAQKLSDKKEYEITFIGGLTSERQQYLDSFGIKHISAFGNEYIKEMQKSKICFNKSIQYDLNAKNLEIMATGTFLLTNYNESFFNLTKDSPLMANIFYKNDDELRDKINYYLNNDIEREEIAKQLQEYILQKHSYDSRAKLLLEIIDKK